MTHLNNMISFRFVPVILLLLPFFLQAQGLEEILQQLKQANKIQHAQVEGFRANKQQDLSVLVADVTNTKQRLAQINQDNRDLEIRIIELQQALETKRKQLNQSRETLNDVIETTQVQYVSFSNNARQFSSWKLSEDHQDLSKRNVDIEDIRQFWIELSGQLVATAKVGLKGGEVVLTNGQVVKSLIQHIGPFSQYSEQYGWLKYLPERQLWQQLEPQPQLEIPVSQWLIDPTFGVMLANAKYQSGWFDTYRPAGVVGVLIGCVAAFGFAIGLFRFVVLTKEQREVNKQLLQLDTPESSNLLGRVLLKLQSCQEAEHIEDVVDASVSKEMPWLNKGIGTLAVLAAIAPLMGLLGTVGGMIETFSILTSQGVSNSELLSGGIAEALLTTKMGLLTAIPLLLLHCVLKSRALSLAEIVEHQVASLVVDKRHRSRQQCLA